MASSSRTPSGSRPTEFTARQADDFSALRRLLLALRTSPALIDSGTGWKIFLRPQEVSQVLPDAIRLRAQQDNRLLASMIPITQEAWRCRLSNLPVNLVTYCPPFWGRPFEKRFLVPWEMLQSLNQTLNIVCL